MDETGRVTRLLSKSYQLIFFLISRFVQCVSEIPIECQCWYWRECCDSTHLLPAELSLITGTLCSHETRKKLNYFTSKTYSSKLGNQIKANVYSEEKFDFKEAYHQIPLQLQLCYAQKRPSVYIIIWKFFMSRKTL